MNAGRITVLGYVLAFLVVPMVGLSILGRPDYSIYHYSGVVPVAVLAVVVILAACATPLFSVPSLVPLPPTWRRSATWLYHALQWSILPISLLLLALVFVLFPPTLANYRYLNTGIAGLGAGFFAAIALKSVITALLVWLLAEYVREPDTKDWGRRLAVLMLAGALLYGASGTGDVFAASFFLLLFLSPRWFIGFATINAGTSLVAPGNLYKYLGIAIIALQVLASISVGENIKDGVGTVSQSIASSVFEARDKVLGHIGETTTTTQPDATPQAAEAVASTGTWFVIRLLEGTASHYYSTMQFFDGFAQTRLAEFAPPLSYPVSAVGYRVGVLLGQPDLARPDIQSISRLNFVVLSLRPSPTEGTSPGPVASFAYLLPVPLAVLVAIVYLAMISALLNWMFLSANRKMSVVGGLVIMIQVQALFQSPLDFILLIDNAFVFLVTIVILALITASAQMNPARHGAVQAASMGQ